MLLPFVTAALAATPFGGVEYTPFSRADLTWVAEERTSGLSVGELDGFVRPALQAFGGAWISDRVALQASVGVARLTATTWVGDTWRQRHWGVVRPAVDVRWSLFPRDDRPLPWLIAGAHGDIPSARDTSNAYDPDEQEAADQSAAIDRARLGGFGGRLGVGVDWRPVRHVAVGALYALEYHRGVLITDDASAWSSWMAGRAGLTLAFEWPPR